MHKSGWNGVADSRRVSQSRFPGSYDEHHVDNAQHLACIRIKQGTPTVAGISRSVQLKNVETAFRAQTAYRFFIELLGGWCGQGNRGDGRNHATVRHG